MDCSTRHVLHGERRRQALRTAYSYFPRNTEFSLGCRSSGHRNVYMYRVSSSTVFLFVSYMHIHVPIIMYCPKLFVVVSKEKIVYILLNMPMFVRSQSFISLPSFVSVSAPVSETREWKQEEKKEKLLWAYNLPIF